MPGRSLILFLFYIFFAWSAHTVYAKDDNTVEGVTLYLKHGGKMAGRLVSETDGDYTIEWKGDNYVVEKSRVKRVERQDQQYLEWKYKNSPVIRRSNGVVVDGEITCVDDRCVTVSFAEGGGNLEMSIDRKEIDFLMFAPVCNKESQEIGDRLKKLFPKMNFYKEGGVTLVTDSHHIWVVAYRKAVRQAVTDIYLKFFRLFKPRKQVRQNFIVIFDDIKDYAEYSVSDGVPFWMVRGYFNPSDEVLYLFNGFGKRMEEWVFEVIIGHLGGSFDDFIKSVKTKYGELTGEAGRYDVFIDGYAKGYKDKFWEMYALYKRNLTDETMDALRHELAHEVFHNMGLQIIVFSKPKADKQKIDEKKKKYLESGDWNAKKLVLEELMNMRKDEDRDFKADAASSWLAEGIASYCATDPIGRADGEWLFKYQESTKKNELLPIEFLTNFKMGSFVGLCPEAMLSAYAESWAITSFLMDKYPDKFMEYQIKMATQKPQKDDDELNWLLKSLDKDLPSLEKEFHDYMKRYPEEEDPRVKAYIEYADIWKK
jgi:hypothetical protein